MIVQKLLGGVVRKGEDCIGSESNLFGRAKEGPELDFISPFCYENYYKIQLKNLCANLLLIL